MCGFGFQVKALKPCQVVPASLGSSNGDFPFRSVTSRICLFHEYLLNFIVRMGQAMEDLLDRIDKIDDAINLHALNGLVPAVRVSLSNPETQGLRTENSKTKPGIPNPKYHQPPRPQRPRPRRIYMCIYIRQERGRCERGG